MSDPEILFPKAKLNKVFNAKTKKFTKKDVFLSFKKELDATFNGSDISISFLDGAAKIYMYRTTFMRKGIYNIISIRHEGKTHRFSYQSIMENEDQLSFIIDELKKLQKSKNIKSVISGVEKMLKDVKEMNK